jgi:hypothetical protein
MRTVAALLLVQILCVTVIVRKPLREWNLKENVGNIT